MCVYCYCPKGKVEALSKYDGFHSKCFVLHLRCKIVICASHVHVIIYISGCGTTYVTIKYLVVEMIGLMDIIHKSRLKE